MRTVDEMKKQLHDHLLNFGINCIGCSDDNEPMDEAVERMMAVYEADFMEMFTTLETKVRADERQKVLREVCIALNGTGTEYDMENWISDLQAKLNQLKGSDE
jgi:hypothetical protein